MSTPNERRKSPVLVNPTFAFDSERKAKVDILATVFSICEDSEISKVLSTFKI